MYEGWNAAREAVGTDIDDIEKEFSAVKPDLFVNILFNLLNAALGTFLGPVFNNG